MPIIPVYNLFVRLTGRYTVDGNGSRNIQQAFMFVLLKK